MHYGVKVNESVCIAKFEQQYVITIIKTFGKKPHSRWLDGRYFIISFILTHLMIAASFLKEQAITPRLLRFFSKYFLYRKQSRYIGVAIYANSLILI